MPLLIYTVYIIYSNIGMTQQDFPCTEARDTFWKKKYLWTGITFTI